MREGTGSPFLTRNLGRSGGGGNAFSFKVTNSFRPMSSFETLVGHSVGTLAAVLVKRNNGSGSQIKNTLSSCMGQAPPTTC